MIWSIQFYLPYVQRYHSPHVLVVSLREEHEEVHVFSVWVTSVLPPRLSNLQSPGWNENEMRGKKKRKRKWKVMKSRLGSGPLISPQQKLFAWLIMNHHPNTLWCKIHNLNIMLRSTSQHSEALLRLPVSMYFAFIHQLKMHLVWIWKYYAKLQCSCKQITVLWDSVVLND